MKFKNIIYLLSIFFVSCDSIQETYYFIYFDSFIAHGGGAIEEFTLTNSLEAMNLSYEKGCRFLELDIITTSDGKFVAAHGWGDFKNMTNYYELSGTPLSEDVFMAQIIYDGFSPMNMDMINKWFEDHPDAILVTDKINNPKLFAEEFLFKDRLIMELFSWEAVDIAIEEGIKPMLSENLVISVPDILDDILQKEIEYVAISKTFLLENRVLLKSLKDCGIMVYVYGLTERYDEVYFLENEMDYIYGMYIDETDILYHIDRIIVKRI
ncbi:MAG: hypothetical protein LBP67_05805 [Bacteroidales bacterium]|jgi:hypothetical protein|nr:hypothetical protein [Bacteroidales bacterium]